MFGRGVRTTIRNGDQTTNRAREEDFPGSPLIDELANESLRRFQGGKKIALKHASKQLHRDFGERAAFNIASIIDHGINVPLHRVLDKVGMQGIKVLNLKALQ